MNRRLALALLATLVLVGSWIVGQRTVVAPPSGRDAAAPTSEPAAAPTPLPSDPPRSEPPPSPGPPSPPDPTRPPLPQAASASTTPPPDPGARTVETELHAVRTLLRDYRGAFQENPVGSNAEIARALAGRNPSKASFLPDTAPRNAKGELIDRWEQPYFFHQISGTEMEIRSAGPDRRMWTADDVSVK